VREVILSVRAVLYVSGGPSPKNAASETRDGRQGTAESIVIEWLIVLFSLCLTLGIAAWVCESPGLRKLVVEIGCGWRDLKWAWEDRRQERAARTAGGGVDVARRLNRLRIF
jgi:hypothetical protein